MLELIGIVGVACILGSYLQLQRGVWGAHSQKYLFTNMTGSFLVILSLFDNWNLPSFLIQSFWIAISLYGLVKYKRMAS